MAIVDGKAKFVDIIMQVYDKHWLPKIAHTPEASDKAYHSMLGHFNRAAVDGDLLDGLEKPLSLANNFLTEMDQRAAKNNLPPLTKPFNMIVNEFVARHGQRRASYTPPSVRYDVPLKELSKEDATAGLCSLFEGLVTTINAPRGESQQTAVARRYLRLLGDMSLQAISQRVDAIMRESKYFPAPSEILKANPVVVARPSADEEPPPADPGCDCDRGWIKLENGPYTHWRACETCALGRWHRQERP